MKCVFCAEKIQDEAILCRFCGAQKDRGRWQPPTSATGRRGAKGRFTMQSTGVLFALSAGFELLSIGGEVPLFGAMRGGLVAALYHLVYVVLFVALGVGLWRGARWGVPLVFAATAFYTLDRLRYLLDRSAMEAQFAAQEGGYGSLFRLLDKGSVRELTVISTLLIVVCWWGFALYVHRRRSYFCGAR